MSFGFLGLGLGLGGASGGIPNNDEVIVGAGQSLIAYWTTQYSGAGAAAFLARAQTYNRGFDFKNYAVGGSAVRKDNVPAAVYWYDTDTSSAATSGTRSKSMIDAINTGIGNGSISSLEAIKRVVWAQGNGDYGSIALGTYTKAQYKASLQAVFDYFRSEIGSHLQIDIYKLHRRTTTGGAAYDEAWQDIADVQEELIAENAWCHFAGEFYDLELADATHLTQAGFEDMAERYADRMAALQGYRNLLGTVGLEVDAVTVSVDEITATLTHDAGTDISIFTGIEGARLEDDGTLLTPSNVYRSSGSVLKARLAAGVAPVYGSTMAWRFPYGIVRDEDAIVLDNATNPLPLRRENTAVTFSDPIMIIPDIDEYWDVRGSVRTMSGSDLTALAALRGAGVASTGSTDPQINETIINGMPGVVSTATTDKLVSDAVFTAGNAHTIGLVYYAPDNTTFTPLIHFANSGGTVDSDTAVFLSGTTGNVNYYRNQAGVATDTGVDGTGTHIIYARFNSASSLDIFLDGEFIANLDPRDDYAAWVKIAYIGNGSLSNVGQAIGAAFHATRALTDEELDDITAHWKERFKLDFPLAADGFEFYYDLRRTETQTYYTGNAVETVAAYAGTTDALTPASDLFYPVYVTSPVNGVEVQDPGSAEVLLSAGGMTASTNRTFYLNMYVPSDVQSGAERNALCESHPIKIVNNTTDFDLYILDDAEDEVLIADGLAFGSHVLAVVFSGTSEPALAYVDGVLGASFTPNSAYNTVENLGFYFVDSTGGMGLPINLIIQEYAGYTAAHDAATVATVGALMVEPSYSWTQTAAVPPQPQLDYPGFLEAVSERQGQYAVKCPITRTNTLYFAQHGDDTTGDGTIGNPYKTIAKANSLMAPDTAFLFKRGDVWEESVGLTLDEINTTAGAYGTGDKPLFNAFRFKLPSGTVWTNLGGGTYSTAVTETVGWIRIEDDRLAESYGSTFALAADATGTGAPVEPWWFWSGGTLTVNMGGNDPTDFDLEYSENNQLSGVVATVDGGRIDNIRCDGYSLDRATPNHNQGYAIRSIAAENEANYITNCEGYYTSAHSIAYLRGTGNASAVMFDGCKAGLAMYNGYGGVTVFNFYSQTGGGECWFINCDTTHGALKTSAWTWNTTKRSGRGFFGHTSSAEYSFNLGVMYNCRTVDSGHTQPVELGGLGNMPDAGDDLTAVRNYIVKCQTGPYTDSGLDEIYFPNRTLFFGNLFYIAPLYSATEGFMFSELLDQWHANDVFIFDWKNQSNVPRMSLYNTTGTDNRPRFWDCAVIHRNLPLDTSTSTYAGLDRDVPFFTEEIVGSDGVGSSIGAEFVDSVLGYVGGFGTNNRYLRLDNRATQVRNSAFFDVNQKSTAGFGSNYDNGVNTVTLSDYWEVDKIITPLIGAGEGDDLVKYDLFGNLRTSNTIGPIDYVASALEVGYYVDTIGVQAAPAATNDNAVFHDAIVNKRYCFDFWTDFESFSDQFIYEEGGLTNGVVAVVKSDGNLEIGAWGSSTIIDKLVHPLSLKSFYRVVVEFNSSTGIQLYVNGVLVDSYVGAFSIGSHSDGGGILTKQSDVFADYSAFGNGTNIALRKIAIWTDFNSHDPNFAQYARYGTVNNVGVTTGGAYVRREMSYDPAITFSPTQLAKLTMWLDASDASTLSTNTDGANITQWNDKSSNNNHMIQDGVNNVPSYDATNQAVYFDRTNTETLLSTNNLGLTQNWFTFDVVSILNADISGQNVVASLDDGSDECCWGASASNTQAVYNGQSGLGLGGTISTANEWVDTPYVTTISSISTAKRHSVNNRTSVTYTTTINAQDGKQRLGGFAAASRNVTCRYHGRIVLARPVDSMELMDLLQYARAHWGVRW